MLPSIVLRQRPAGGTAMGKAGENALAKAGRSGVTGAALAEDQEETAGEEGSLLAAGAAVEVLLEGIEKIVPHFVVDKKENDLRETLTIHFRPPAQGMKGSFREIHPVGTSHFLPV